MLRMSKLADYGTVVMTCIARTSGRKLSASEIVDAVGLETPTVSKLLKLLLHAGLLTSQRGARGGYALSRPAEKISVADIIAAIEGYPLGLTECSSMPGLCTRELSCAVRGNWQRISQAIRATLEQVSLAELAQPVPQSIDFKQHAKPAYDADLDLTSEVQHEYHGQTTG